MLDDTQKDNDPDTRLYMFASLDTARYNWLVHELDKGQAEGKLMLIAADIPISNEPANSSQIWTPASPVSEQKLIEKLHTYPNLVLWLAGHVHRNTITGPRPSRARLLGSRDPISPRLPPAVPHLLD